MTEPTRKVLLALLDDPTRERYGLDLSKHASVAPGTMYGVLDRLEGWAWVESRIAYPADLAAPPRRYYRLTRDGAARAQAARDHADRKRRSIPVAPRYFARSTDSSHEHPDHAIAELGRPPLSSRRSTTSSGTQSQRRHSENTREVVAPLARTLGLTDIGFELDELATATLRAQDAIEPTRTTAGFIARLPMGVRSLQCVLHIGAFLLPARIRNRWIQEWEGELHAAGSFAHRLRLVASVLLSMPALAIISRS